MLSVVYTSCQRYYGIMFYGLSCVLSLFLLCVKRQCATAARTAVNDLSELSHPEESLLTF